MSNWTHHRARVASLSRIHPADHPDVIEARQALKCSRLEDYVSKVLAEAPPLTDEQRNRVARLLAPSSHTLPATGGGRR